MARKLGRLAVKHDPRTLDLARYIDPAALPAVPPAIDWGAKVAQWGMLANDRVGDCTVASACHMTQTWTEVHGAEALITDDEALAAYSAITGYDPARPDTDTGANELDVLRFWRSSGIAGHRIGAFASIHRHDLPRGATWLDHLCFAIDAFGGAYLGAAMPESAQTQTVWSVPSYGPRPGPRGDGTVGSWGGHAFHAMAYRPAPAAQGGRIYTVVSWGERIDVTASWMLTYVEEAYAALSPDWIDGTRPAPSGFDLRALTTDLVALAR